MNDLENYIVKIKKDKSIALMTHVVIGYPSLKDTNSLVKTMVQSGADIVELQIPFSDPLADGPTIMKACETSLAQGTKVSDAFVIMKQLSGEVSVPLFFMAYYNTIFAYGVDRFCGDAQKAGAAGLIVPDMPLDEEAHEHFYALCKQYNLQTIQVLSPASTDIRMKKNARIANGFVYFTAQQGTTGVRKELDKKLSSNLSRVRKYFTVPIAVGFGISQKEHIAALQGKADIAVVGSALLDIISSVKPKERLSAVETFLHSLRIAK